MKDFFYSFYGKLSAVLLLLLLILGSAQLYITYESSMKLISAADQQLNLNLADHIASDLEPVLTRKAPQKEVNSSIHYLMIFNPRIEIYVLNKKGKIINFFADPKVVKAKRVPLKPVHSFLKNSPKDLILGQDPRNPGKLKPFSAAKVNLGEGQTGYLYIILSSQRYNSALKMVQDSYIIGTSLKLLVLILVLTAIVGLILFRLLTRRLRQRRDIVERFEQGDYNARLEDQSRDELGQLGRSFNHMADTIQANVKELQKTDKLRRNLIANISHDLRSPLASIQGYLETILIKEDTITEEERRRYLQVIMNNTELLRNLVGNLFELSKLDAQQVKPKKEIFSIAELLQDVIIKLRPHADNKNVSLTTDFSHDVPAVWADIGLIERVITNLLENAIDYSGSGGKVKICLIPKAEQLMIEIRDNGPGISKEEMPLIFDRFHRGDKSRSLAEGNTGLGLAIAKKILELHQSNIHAESEEGKGTCFSFNLPLYKADSIER